MTREVSVGLVHLRDEQPSGSHSWCQSQAIEGKILDMCLILVLNFIGTWQDTYKA